jgi:hypothetical protein
MVGIAFLESGDKIGSRWPPLAASVMFEMTEIRLSLFKPWLLPKVRSKRYEGRIV